MNCEYCQQHLLSSPNDYQAYTCYRHAPWKITHYYNVAGYLFKMKISSKNFDSAIFYVISHNSNDLFVRSINLRYKDKLLHYTNFPTPQNFSLQDIINWISKIKKLKAFL